MLILVAVQLHFSRRAAAMTIRIRLDTLTISMAAAAFRSTTGEALDGDSASMFRTLLGSNNVKVVFLSTGNANDRGEKVDPWGTPYRINMIHNTNLLIHSAGRNRKFDDGDDFLFDSNKTNFVKQPK